MIAQSTGVLNLMHWQQRVLCLSSNNWVAETEELSNHSNAERVEESGKNLGNFQEEFDDVSKNSHGQHALTVLMK